MQMTDRESAWKELQDLRPGTLCLELPPGVLVPAVTLGSHHHHNAWPAPAAGEQPVN